MHTDAAFNSLSDLAQSAGAHLVHQIERWSNKIDLTIRDVLNAETLAPGTVVDLSVTIDMPPQWQQNVDAEMKKLTRHFGVPDDD